MKFSLVRNARARFLFSVAGLLPAATCSLLSSAGCSEASDEAATSPVVVDAGAADDATTDGSPPDVDQRDASADADQGDAFADGRADAADAIAIDPFITFSLFTLADQISLATNGTINSVPSSGYRIVQSTRASTCGAAERANTATIRLDLAKTGTPLATGTYAVTNGPGTTTWVDGFYEVLDGQCAKTENHAAQSGTIVISQVDAVSVKGTYDLMFAGFGRPARAIGGFDAPRCAASAIDAGSPDAGKTCLP